MFSLEMFLLTKTKLAQRTGKDEVRIRQLKGLFATVFDVIFISEKTRAA